MRVLHVVPTYLPAVRYGGPIYSVHALCRGLACRGHEVHVYTTNVDGPDISDVPVGDAVPLDGVSVRYFPCSWGRRLYRSPVMARELEANVRSFDILHLHSVYLWPTLTAARLARAADVPYVLAPRGMLVADLIARKRRILKTAWIQLFERTNVAGAAAIHVTSELEREELLKLKLSTRRVVVVANGIDLPDAFGYHVPQTLSRRPIILSVGRINWKKGLDRLIAAMAYVQDAELLIAGNDEENYQPRLEAKVHELGLSDRVRFLGQVRDQEKWNLMRSARLFAMPSYSENFGVAALEAMACGRPVAVSANVGLARAVKEGGAGIIISDRPEDMGAEILRLLGDPARCNTMGAAAKKLAEREFSWLRIAERMEEAYFDVLNERINGSVRNDREYHAAHHHLQ